MSECKVRNATMEEMQDFFPAEKMPTARGWCGEVDGKVVALGGYAFVDDRWYAFFDLRDEARKYKMAIVRTAKEIMRHADEHNIKVLYAHVGEGEPLAEKWLRSMDFRPSVMNPALYMRGSV